VTTGLRERKKRETRQAISDIATALFVEHGFDAVTIAQVAQAAGVAKMTVTNYFPRKEDLVFDRAEGIVSSLADAVASGDVTLGLSSPAFAAMIEGSPVLASRGLEILAQRERALSDAIAAETGADTVQQRVVAAQLSAPHRVLGAEASRRSRAGQPRAEILQVLARESERAFDLLEPSLGGYLIRPA
jgi:AcrR family transcriptional regulator